MDIASLGIVVKSDGIQQAERALDSLTRAGTTTAQRAKDIAKAWGPAFGAAIAAGVGAASVAVIKWTRDTANLGVEIDRLSRLSGANTEQFQRQAAAARSVGIEQGKLADIFKDTQDKVGDFLANGGGELKDFFDNIAKGAGVTAEQFRRLSGPDALQLYFSTLEKAGVSQSEMVFYLEAIADEASGLIPLLRNGGRGMKELGDQAQALGGVLSGDTIAASKQLKGELWRLEQQFDGIKAEIGAEVIPTVRELAHTLNDREFREGFKSLATGFADTIAWAIKAAGEIGKATQALREFFGENSRKSTVGLQNRRDELWLDTSKLEGQKQRGGGLFGGANDPISKLLGLPSNFDEKIAANRREMAEIDRLLAQRATESMVDNAMRDSRALWSTGTGATPTPRAIPKPSKGGGTSDAKREAQEALRAAQALADAQAEFRSQLLDMQADLAGPLAQANRDYERSIGELSRSFEEGKVTLADYATAQDVLAEKRDRAVAAINAQITPTQQVARDLQFETEMLGRSAKEQARMIVLRQAGADAASEEGQRIAELSDRYYDLAEQQAAINDIRGAATDMFASFIDGSSSAGDAFEDFTKRLRRLAAQMLAEKAIQWLLSSMFGSGAGVSRETFGYSAGTQVSDINFFGGGRARGGPVAGDKLYEVGEGGRPELFQQGGRTYLIPGNAGAVVPASGGVVGQYAAPMRGGGGSASSAPSVEINVTNQAGGRAEVSDTNVQFNEFGKMIVNLTIAEVDRRIGSMGSTGRAIQGRFGVSPQGVSRG